MEKQVKKILVSNDVDRVTNGQMESQNFGDSIIYTLPGNSRLVLMYEYFRGQIPYKEFVFHTEEKELRIKFPFIYSHEDCYVKWVEDFILGITIIESLKCLFILGKYEYELY